MPGRGLAEEETLSGSSQEEDAIREAVSQLADASTAKKCWSCGCLQGSVATIERALPEAERPAELSAALRAVRQRFVEVAYDCLGCEVCHPALAINALSRGFGEAAFEVDTCPRDSVRERSGWPPLPGSYNVLRYHAPVAICTLNEAKLSDALAQAAPAGVSLVGTMQTENLGIERLISNVIANPHIRFLILAGADSRQAIGHLPGQSLLALATAGLDERSRILGARGKRPVLKNISKAAVEHFRRFIVVVDLIGETDVDTIVARAEACASNDAGPALPFAPVSLVPAVQGYLPDRMIPDAEGYFVVYTDLGRRSLALEHYRKDGVLHCIIEGKTAAELYWPAIERRLISRLDHAAYLGRELARAEHALRTGSPYTQDGAPEKEPEAPARACGCNPTCLADGP